MPEILLIRHAESESNRAGIWNGRSESPLTPEGEASLEALRRRFSRQEFDVVLSSPLDRARRTAAVVTPDYEIEDDLVEMHLGRWEGRTYQDVIADDGDLLAEVMAGKDVRLGISGETVAEVSTRAWATIQRLVDRLGPRGRG